MPLRSPCSFLSALFNRYSRPLNLAVCTLSGSLVIPVSTVLATLKIIADTVIFWVTYYLKFITSLLSIFEFKGIQSDYVSKQTCREMELVRYSIRASQKLKAHLGHSASNRGVEVQWYGNVR